MSHIDNNIHDSNMITEKNENPKEQKGFLNIFNFKEWLLLPSLEDQINKHKLSSSAEQKTPFRINRYIILLFYFISIVLTNRLFFAWPNLSNLLFRDNAYVWKCDSNKIQAFGKPSGKRYICDEQDSAVQAIFIYGSSAYFAFSFFNGLIVDYVGSKISALLGFALNIAGWLLIVLSSEKFQGYVIGGILASASIDLATFSTLNVSGLFPGNENLIINIISGAGSLSSGVLTIIDYIIVNNDLSFKNFMLWYLFIVIGIFFILSLFLLPNNRYYRQYEIDNYYKKRGINLPQNDMSNSIENGNFASIKNKNSHEFDEKNLEKNKDIEMDNHDLNKISYEKIISLETKKTNEYTSTNNSSIVYNKTNNRFKSTRINDLFNICTSAHFICLLIYGPLNTIYNTFYYSVVENILSKEKNDMLGILLPFSVIPCIILGNITDKFGVMVMIFYELIFAFCMYAFSYLKSDFGQWASIISGTLYSACANGQIWTIVSSTFSSKYHPTLIGLLQFIGGIVSFVRLLLFDWAIYCNYNFTYINLFILGLICINIAVAIFIVIIRKRKGAKVTYGDEKCKEMSLIKD